MRLITNIIEIFFVTYSLNLAIGEKYRLRNLGSSILLYLPCFFLVEDNSWQVYIGKNIYLLLIFIIYLFNKKMNITRFLPLICALLSVSGSIKILVGVIGGLSVLFVKGKHLLEQTTVALTSVIFMGVAIFICIHILKKRIVNVEFSFSKKCISYFIYFLVVFGKIPFFYSNVTENKVIKAMVVASICCTIIFFIISRIERRNAEMERAKIEENNKELSTKLHKSQEIIPAVVQILNDVTENSGKEMEEHETQKLLTEMTDLFGQQLKQNSKEDLQLKNFCSTGLIILDQQLKVYQMEAIDRGVNFDIYVQAPINELIKRDNIDQMKLQRALGDLIRNAFRAIERNSKKCRAKGHILLIIGCRYEGILEIAVVDNGEEFPLHVIEAFGKRGVTSWGTGNGLADMVEFAQETKASICVEEFDGKTNSFTKKVSMIFDKCRKNYYNSVRKELIEGSFWEKIEYL